MTKLVEFTRDVRPLRKGQRMAVNDATAFAWAAAGDVIILDDPHFTTDRPQPAAQMPRRRGYLTRGR